MSVPERRVLEQDRPQYEQSVKAKRIAQAKREQQEYDTAQKQYESDVAKYEQEQKAAEEKYQRELAEYNRQLEEYNKSGWGKYEETAKNYDEKIKTIKEQRDEALRNVKTTKMVRDQSKPNTWYEKPLSREEKKIIQNSISKKYNSQIEKVQREKNERLQLLSFSIKYPGQRIQPSTLKTFRKDTSSKAPSLVTLYEREKYNRAAELEAAKRSGAQTARAVAVKQKAEMGIIGTTQTSYGLREGSERAAAVKPTQMPSGTLFPAMPMQAEKTRRPMINVDTGQSIMGAQRASPAVTVKTVENRYEIQTAEGTKTFKTKETAQRYLEKKQITVPIKPVLREVTRTIPAKPESRGAPLLANPLAKLAGLTKPVPVEGSVKEQPQKPIFSFQNISEVKEPSGLALLEFQSQLKTRERPSQTVYAGILEERGLPMTPLSRRIIDAFSSKGKFAGYVEPVQAKGRKGIISKDGKQIFDIETGMGDVTIGRKLGFVYDYNLQRPTTETPKMFEGTLQYVLSPKVQGPPKPRYETVVAVPGSLEYAVQNQTKPTPFNKLIESSYKSVDEFQSSLQKNYPIVSAVGPSQALETVKIGIATAGFIASGTEQYVDPFVQEKLGLKKTIRPAPLVLSETSDEVLLPVDIGRSFESKSIVPKERYFEGIYEYGKKYGAGSLVVGGATYYAGKGILQVPKKGFELVGIAGQSQKLLLKESEELQTVYRGITFRNRPILGFQEGKPRIGIDYSKIPYEKIDIKNPVYARSGMEAALGSGIEKFTFYSRPALKVQREKGVISELSEQRAIEITKGTEMGIRVESKVGSFAQTPFENLSKRQSDYLFKKTAQLQKQKKVEAVHGSVALGAQVPKPIQSSIKFGDIDIVPTKPTVVNANKLLESIAHDFPLESGQRIKTVKPSSATTNRQLLLFTEGKKEPEKILEVVLKGDEKLPSGESIVTKGTNILGFKIPFGKSVKEKSFGLKVHTANYQLLTNVKQAISYQKGTGRELLDIYPSSGRVKDVARTYLNLKAKAIFKGGKKGEALDIQAEKIRSLYNIDFGDIGAEKIVISSSPPKAISITNKITPEIIPTATIKTESIETKPRVQSVRIMESEISIRPSRSYSYHPRVSVTPSKIQSLKQSIVQSIRPSSVQTSRMTTSKRPSIKPSRTTYRIRVPRTQSTRSTITKIPPTSRFYTPPSRITSTPPSRIPPSYRITPPSRITSTPPSRIPPSYRITPPPTTITTLPPIRKTPILLTTEGKIPKSVLKKQKEKADYLGNVSEVQLEGIFGRTETVYGQKKISRLLKGDIRVVQGKKRTVRITKEKKDILGFGKKKKANFW